MKENKKGTKRCLFITYILCETLFLSVSVLTHEAYFTSS
jgi:hypothetical protein